MTAFGDVSCRRPQAALLWGVFAIGGVIRPGTLNESRETRRDYSRLLARKRGNERERKDDGRKDGGQRRGDDESADSQRAARDRQ